MIPGGERFKKKIGEKVPWSRFFKTRAMFKTATITEEKNAIKIWERVLEARLRITVENCDVQLGFMPRRSTTDTIFTLRMVMEKFMEGQRGLQWVFIDLQKAYDKVPKD